MKAIDLSGKRGRGIQAVVSDQDFNFLCQWKWQLSSNGYAVRYTTKKNCQNKTISRAILMHRVIAERINLDMSAQIDHRNRNRLDNQRGNLRSATRSQNLANSGASKVNSTGFKGVSLKAYGRFRAQIRINGTSRHLGYFSTAKLAYKAYCEAAKSHHGEFFSE